MGVRGSEWVASAALLLVAALWGLTFPLIRGALASVDPFHFVAARFALAALAFLPWVLASPAPRRGLPAALGPGFALGALACASYLTQTLGLRTVPAGRAAFITGTNVVLVPLLAPLFGRGVPRRIDLAGALLSLVGLLLMTRPEVAGFSAGDLWVLACAFFYALYIHALQQVLARGIDTTALAFSQVAGLCVSSALCLPLAEGPSHFTASAWLAVSFCALLATVGTFWLQTHFQGRTSPERAALLFATEPVFAAFFAALLLGERTTPREGVGAALVFLAVLLVELWPKPAPAG
ncbi:MAG: DMT family transporter [Deltaproteobacteria bacterium]|nr:MAG: DMT family transporter [Deltaproteobacteria bacterium]